MDKISVIIPVAIGEDVRLSIDSLKKVDYPKDKIEIFVVEGNQPSAQRNKAIDLMKGNIIFFFDNDSYVKEDNIKMMLKWHKKEKVVGVGGPAETIKTDPFLQKCFGYVLGSFFATSNMRARFKGIGKARYAGEEDLILCNLSMKADIVKKDKFNEKLYPSEENELMNRLKKKGYKFVYDPKIKVYRPQRRNLRKFMKQFFTYGRSRMEHFFIKPEFLKPYFLFPTLFVLYLISLIFMSKLPSFIPKAVYLIPLMLYVFLVLFFSFKILSEEKNLKTIFVTPFLFPLVHIPYGVGVIYGLYTSLKRKKEKDIKIKIRKISLKK